MGTNPEARVREVELRLLADGVRDVWGHDLKGYAPEHLRAGVARAMKACGVSTLAEYLHRLLRDRASLHGLIQELLPRTPGLFADGTFYRDFRTRVIPRLRTYPSIRIWLPSCAGAEQAMSLAVILEEEGLGRRSQLYATSECDEVFANARRGRVSARRPGALGETYRKAGGRKAFGDYFRAGRNGVTLKGALLSRIVFATHHLATDDSINQFQAIVCRGVLATYGNEFAARIHDLFHRSLGVFGFLGLGKQESLEMSPHRDCYSLLAQGSRLYWREC